MSIDLFLFHLLNNLAGRSPFLDGVIVFFASYFAYVLVALFLGLLFISNYPHVKKLQILVVTGLSSVMARFGITELIRYFYHRPRPFSVLQDVHTLFTDSAWSFPSGHATFFFAMATAVYFYNKRWGVWLFAGTVVMTLARVAAGVHYPSDIVGGAIIGMFVAYLTYLVCEEREEEPEQAEKPQNKPENNPSLDLLT